MHGALSISNCVMVLLSDSLNNVQFIIFRLCMCVSIDFVFAHRSCYNQDFEYFSCRLSLWETGNKIGIQPISSFLDFTSENMGEFHGIHAICS